MKQAIGDFLLRRLEEAGVNDLFGVPGDFNLEFMQQLEDRRSPRWVGCCNELNASYAADGYARLSGLSAMVVTYGVGALSAVNGVAGAMSEHVPVICICGSLPRSVVARSDMMHHTLADGGHDAFLRVFQQITAAQARLTPHNARLEIDRIVRTAWQLKRPVYLELPSDIAYLEIDVPDDVLELDACSVDDERVSHCASLIAERLSVAERPAFLIDLDADRFGVLPEVTALAEKRGISVATMATTKGAFSETSPLFAGAYAGTNSPAAPIIEASDCLITVGYRRIDSTSAFFTDRLPDNVIRLGDFWADIDGEFIDAISLGAVLRGVLAELDSHSVSPVGLRATGAVAPVVDITDAPLTQDQLWGLMQSFIRPGDVVIAEDGTSSSGAGSLTLPEGCTYINQAIWGSIGYSLGCLLGTLVAAPQRRHLLFIGDGSFQLTAQELSTILRHDLKPVIFLINNGGYTIERTILGAQAKYNDVANWRYADLPKTFCRREVRAFTVTSSNELQAALTQINSEFAFVELVMDSLDAPPGLIAGGHASAALDYGPRGPQKRAGIQIELDGAR